MNSTAINDLFEVLETEARLYRDLENISGKKTNIIVEGKVSELENIVKMEQSLLVQLGKLEDEREEMIGQLSKELDVNPAGLSISRLVDYVEEEQAKKLKSLQKKIMNTINDLKESNQLNSNLIKNSLEYIDFSINLVTAAAAADNNYGNSGQVNDLKKRNFFDARL